VLSWICAGCAAALAGFSRGYAAFGTALLYVPLMTLAFDLRTALVTLFLIDLLPALPLVGRALQHGDAGVLRPMALGALLSSPCGLILLLHMPPHLTQAAIGTLSLAAVGALSVRPGWRFAGGWPQSLAAGAAAGLVGGLSGIFGPPAMIYLLGRQDGAVTTRANATVFMTLESLILGAGYAAAGMVTSGRLLLALGLAPIYGGALWLGAHSFAHTGAHLYRRLMLALLAIMGLVLLAGA